MRHSFNETHVNNATYARAWIADKKMSLVERLNAFFELFLSDNYDFRGRKRNEFIETNIRFVEQKSQSRTRCAHFRRYC